MITVTLTEAKRKLLGLIEAALGGQEVIIAKDDTHKVQLCL